MGNEQETTQNVTNFLDQAMTWLVTNGTAFAVKLVIALILLVIGHYIIKAVCAILQGALKRAHGLNEMIQSFIVNVAGKAMWLLLWLIVLSQLGVQIGPILAGVGVAGFVVGFAFQDSLSNFAAGFMILLNSPFKKGDLVEVSGLLGSVTDITLMATLLTTPDNKRITVPNKCVWGASIVNYSALEKRRVDLTIGVAYGSNISKAREVILAALKKIPLVLQEPAPTIEVVNMGDSSVNFVVRPWCKTADYWTVYFAGNQAVKEALDAAGIEIPFPQRVVHMKTSA